MGTGRNGSRIFFIATGPAPGPPPPCGVVFDFVAGDHGRGGIRSMCGIGNQNFFARIALFLQVGANQQQSRQFSLRSRGRLERNRIHARHLQQAFFQQPHDFQASLRKRLWLVRVFGGEAIEPRHELIDARVVLHGAGAERIHAQVDGIVPSRKPREVAQNFDFAHLRETFDAFPAVMRAECFDGIRGGHIKGRQFERALAR